MDVVRMEGMFEIHISKVVHSPDVTRKQKTETEETEEASES